MAKKIANVVFDLGGVLIDWNPRYLYRDLFKGDEAAMEHFLTQICSHDWNLQQDAGRSFAEAGAVLKSRYPDQADLIDAWLPGFNKMLAGPIAGTVDLLARLRDDGVPIYALTNWSAETFPVARQRFDFLDWFKGIVVSGHEKVAKPDPRIFEILTARYELDPRVTLFIDDNAANVATARDLAFHTVHFTAPEDLAAKLHEFDLLPLQRCA